MIIMILMWKECILYERKKAGCQKQMEKCCCSISNVTRGSIGAEC